jgi:hypothetical protein
MSQYLDSLTLFSIKLFCDLSPSAFDIYKKSRKLLYNDKIFTQTNKIDNIQIYYKPKRYFNNNNNNIYDCIYTGGFIISNAKDGMDYMGYRNGNGTMIFSTVQENTEQNLTEEPIYIESIHSDSWYYDIPYNNIDIKFVNKHNIYSINDNDVCSICLDKLLCDYYSEYFISKDKVVKKFKPKKGEVAKKSNHSSLSLDNYTKCENDLDNLYILYTCGHFFHLNCLNGGILPVQKIGSLYIYNCPTCRTPFKTQDVIRVKGYISYFSSKSIILNRGDITKYVDVDG